MTAIAVFIIIDLIWFWLDVVLVNLWDSQVFRKLA
jgi:hypothetical protein